MPHFFIDKVISLGDCVVISGTDFHHMRNVLRLKAGDRFELCDAAAVTFTMLVEDIGANELTARADTEQKKKVEPPLEITLFQGLPKADKMDRLIRQSVELGVSRLVPVAMEHCVVKLEDKRAGKRIQRWQAIAESAAKQCGRSRIPEVTEPISTKAALRAIAAADYGFICYEQSREKSLADLLHGQHSQDYRDKSLAFLIGPEGGVSVQEAELAEELAIPMITLGPRILRTETAAPAVLAMIALLTELS